MAQQKEIVFDWYTESVKKLNDFIWVPNKNTKCYDLKYKFNSEIINFDSFGNTLINELESKYGHIASNEIKKEYDNIKDTYMNLININRATINNAEQYYYNYVNEKYKGINNLETCKEYLKEYNEHNDIILKLIDEYLQITKDYENSFNDLNEKFNIYHKFKFKNIKINDYKSQEYAIKESFNKRINILYKEINKLHIEHDNYIKEMTPKLLSGKNYNVKLYKEHINEYNSKMNKFKAKRYKMIDNYNKSLKMINKVVRSHKMKLKFNPEQKAIIIAWMDECDRVYNYCIKLFNRDTNFPKNYMSGKMYVFNKLYKSKQNKPAPYDVLTYTIKVFYDNLASNYKLLENKQITHFEMKPINNKNFRTITIITNCIGGNGIYATILKKNNLSKKFNTNNIACDCKLSYDRTSKKFYLYIPQYIDCKPTDVTKQPIAALDPGEKVFMTYFSLNDYGFIGNDIRIPILKIEEKIKKFQRLLVQTTVNGKKVNKKNKNDKPINRKNVRKRIQHLYKKIKGIVNELHKKTALFLCKNFNVILIPEFGTKQMISNGNKNELKSLIKKKVAETKTLIKDENKEDPLKLKQELKNYKRRSRLNGRVKFVLSQESHYTFQQHLLNKAKEYGCSCITVTEEFTSQLCTKCGNLDKTFVGRIKKCKHCSNEIHRDVNGARNILLKNISSHLRV